MADVAQIEGPEPQAVLLTEVGEKYIQVIKEVRIASGLGLKEAKDLVDRVRVARKELVIIGPIEVVEHTSKRLTDAGATVEIHLAADLQEAQRATSDAERLGSYIRQARDLAAKLHRDTLSSLLHDALEEWHDVRVDETGWPE